MYPKTPKNSAFRGVTLYFTKPFFFFLFHFTSFITIFFVLSSSFLNKSLLGICFICVFYIKARGRESKTELFILETNGLLSIVISIYKSVCK